MTHTYATLNLSAAAYAEITQKLRAAGYDHAFHKTGLIDMHGIALTTASPPDLQADDLSGLNGEVLLHDLPPTIALARALAAVTTIWPESVAVNHTDRDDRDVDAAVAYLVYRSPAHHANFDPLYPVLDANVLLIRSHAGLLTVGHLGHHAIVQAIREILG